MSKYYKDVDVIKTIGLADKLADSIKDDICDALAALATIEVAEDTISKQWLLDAFGLSEKTRKYGGDHSGYNTLMLYEIQDRIEDAPSVIPKTQNADGIKEYILSELADLLDEYSELDENGLHDPKWCGVHEAYLIVKNASPKED